MLKLKKKAFPSSQGFTLIEVMIALAVFSIGILGASVMQGVSIQGNSKASNILESVSWGSDQLEQLLTMDLDDIALEDTKNINGTHYNGTDRDLDGDGIDDDYLVDGSNFGLDDVPGDGTFVSPDGLYTVNWNVAVDCPVEGNKTIRVIIGRSDWGVAHSISMTYVRMDKI